MSSDESRPKQDEMSPASDLLSGFSTTHWNGRKSQPVKVYSNLKKCITTVLDPVVLLVRLEWLNGALSGDCVWAFETKERNAETFKSSKYVKIVAAIGNGQEIDMPWLYFDKGRTRIMDGRHRLYAFIDLGFSHTYVVVDPECAMAIATLVDPDARAHLKHASPEAGRP